MSSGIVRSEQFPGFDGLRLVAAIAVIFSHSFLIATGSEAAEPLVNLLGPKNALGLYGVFTFFSISGFLLARSLANDGSAITFATNRALRILPAFLVWVLVAAFALGPSFSSLSPNSYFSDPRTIPFVLDSVNTIGGAGLPGLFAYGTDELARSVNGSLWSLRYEVLSYLLLLVLWVVLRSSVTVMLAIGLLAVVTQLPAADGQILPGVAYTLPYFAGGILVHGVHQRFGVTGRGAVVCALALAVSAVFGLQKAAFALFGAYLIVFAGEQARFLSAMTQRLGDCSYGVYLWGWPIQQVVKQVTGTSSPAIMFLLAVPAALLLGYVSCHAIERPAMSRRKLVSGRLNAFTTRLRDWLGPGSRTAERFALGGFVIGSLIVLASKELWYYFVASMSGVIVLTAGIALIAGAAAKRVVSSQSRGKGTS